MTMCVPTNTFFQIQSCLIRILWKFFSLLFISKNKMQIKTLNVKLSEILSYNIQGQYCCSAYVSFFLLIFYLFRYLASSYSYKYNMLGLWSSSFISRLWNQMMRLWILTLCQKRCWSTFLVVCRRMIWDELQGK